MNNSITIISTLSLSLDIGLSLEDESIIKSMIDKEKQNVACPFDFDNNVLFSYTHNEYIKMNVVIRRISERLDKDYLYFNGVTDDTIYLYQNKIHDILEDKGFDSFQKMVLRQRYFLHTTLIDPVKKSSIDIFDEWYRYVYWEELQKIDFSTIPPQKWDPKVIAYAENYIKSKWVGQIL